MKRLVLFIRSDFQLYVHKLSKKDYVINYNIDSIVWTDLNSSWMVARGVYNSIYSMGKNAATLLHHHPSPHTYTHIYAFLLTCAFISYKLNNSSGTLVLLHSITLQTNSINVESKAQLPLFKHSIYSVKIWSPHPLPNPNSAWLRASRYVVHP